MAIGNRGLFGQPALPYVDFRSYAGADVFLGLTFLDYTNALVIPTEAHYQVDDITNSIPMIPNTNIVITGSTVLVQIPGIKLPMTHDYQGSQLCQVYISATYPGIPPPVAKTVRIIELITIQTPGGAGI